MALGKVVCDLLSSPKLPASSWRPALGPSSLQMQVTIGRLPAGITASFCGLGWVEGLSVTVLLCIYTQRDACVLPVSQLGTCLKPGQKPGRETRWWWSIPDPPMSGVQPLTPISTQFQTCGDPLQPFPRLFREMCVWNNLVPSTYLQNKPRTARRETGNCCLSNLILFYFFFIFWALKNVFSLD